MHMLMHRRDTETLATRCSAAWRLAAGGCCGLALAAAVALAGVRPARAQDGPRPADAAHADDLRSAIEEARALEQAHDQLNKQAEDAKQVAEVHRLRAVQVKAAAAAKVDALKQQLKADAGRSADDDEKALLDKELAARHEALRKREADIAAMQEKLKAADRDLAKRQQALEEQQRKHQGAGQGLKEDLDRRLKETTFDGKKAAAEDGADPHAKVRKAMEKARQAESAKDLAGETDDWFAEVKGAGRAAAAASAGGMKVDAGAIDLVSLATSYADAVGDVRMAEARVAMARESDQAGVARLEAAGLEKARHKARLLRGIAEVALRGAAEKHERTRQLYDRKLSTQAEVSEAESRVHILKLILDTGDAPAKSSLQRQ
jgi:hypothetical protein